MVVEMPNIKYITVTIPVCVDDSRAGPRHIDCGLKSDSHRRAANALYAGLRCTNTDEDVATGRPVATPAGAVRHILSQISAAIDKHKVGK